MLILPLESSLETKRSEARVDTSKEFTTVDEYAQNE